MFVVYSLCVQALFGYLLCKVRMSILHTKHTMFLHYILVFLLITFKLSNCKGKTLDFKVLLFLLT